MASAGRETEHHDSTWPRLFTPVDTPLLRCAIAGDALQASPTGYNRRKRRAAELPVFHFEAGKVRSAPGSFDNEDVHEMLD